MITTGYAFVAGAVTMGFSIAALFFLRFWRRTRDGLFLAFAIAFLLLGVNQVLVVLAHVPEEDRSPLFLFILAAFAIIIWAVFQKSRRR